MNTGFFPYLSSSSWKKFNMFMFFKEIFHFILVVKFIGLKILIIFSYYHFVSVGSVVIPVFTDINLCLLYFMISLVKDLPILLIFSKNCLLFSFLFFCFYVIEFLIYAYYFPPACFTFNFLILLWSL